MIITDSSAGRTPQIPGIFIECYAPNFVVGQAVAGGPGKTPAISKLMVTGDSGLSCAKIDVLSAHCNRGDKAGDRVTDPVTLFVIGVGFADSGAGFLRMNLSPVGKNDAEKKGRN